MKIQILVDNIKSWILPYAIELQKQLLKLNHEVELIHEQSAIIKNDILFILGCEKIIKSDNLKLSQYPIVVHESKLPMGKGWSPLTWQILEGKKEIPITLFKAIDRIDAGEIYLQESMYFQGHELLEEIKNIQGEYTLKMCLKFAQNCKQICGIQQIGKESFYAKRTSKDSKLDPSKTIIEQFNLLRVCDNERYPAYFEHEGHTYYIKIYKKETN